jgi:putative ABC transport system permease protein
LLITLAAYFTGSIKLTLWTAFAISSSFFCLICVAATIQVGTQKLRIKLRRNPKLRWALSAITGPKEGAIIVILSIGIGLSVLSSIGQISGNIRAAIQQDLPDVAPSYFFIDIQKSQMPEFRQIMESNNDVISFDEAPMIRGIISKINGIPAKEFAGEHWVLSGDRGITYSSAPLVRSKITEGVWWEPDYKGPAQISFAYEEGKEMGLSLGDELTVNIMGRDINATITSFRDVDFSSAGIGFIMSMNPYALQSAPHSFISTVYANPKAEAELLRKVAGKFPNITAVRIKEAIAQVSNILTSISSVVLYGATTTILTGFLVLIGTAASTEKARKYEAAILKAIGASEASILFSFALRSILLGGVAGVIALAIGVIGAWAVCNYIMGTEYSIIWLNAFSVVVGGVLANVFASLYFSIKAMRISTSSVLRSEY